MVAELPSFTVVTREVPVSVNKLYSGKSHRFLSPEGKKFKDTVAELVAYEIIILHGGSIDHHVYMAGRSYHLELDLYLRQVKNPAWAPGEKTRSGKPSSPYKQVDTSNYVKIIEDAVATGTGIDDSACSRLVVNRHEDPLDPRIIIKYTIAPRE